VSNKCRPFFLSLVSFRLSSVGGGETLLDQVADDGKEEEEDEDGDIPKNGFPLRRSSILFFVSEDSIFL
jgi:hypothetical protein